MVGIYSIYSIIILLFFIFMFRKCCHVWSSFLMSQLRKVSFMETLQLFSFVYLICSLETQFEEHTKTKGTILCTCSKHIFASQISLQKSQSHQSKKQTNEFPSQFIAWFPHSSAIFLPPRANVMFGHVYSFKGKKHQNVLLPFTVPYLICYI